MPAIPVEGALSALGAVAIEQVRRTPREALVEGLIARYHYLGYKQPVGEQLKYLVTSHVTIAVADRAVGASGPGQPLIALDRPPEAAHPPAFVLFTLLWLIAPLAARCTG